jgi:epoxyqueuosine reductase
VARYARGDDYHRFMEQGLRRLAARVEEAFPETVSKVYVDTGPVLERELAARAGLGSVGKNTSLLDPEIGSWFLLGELFLTLDFDPDIPASDLCGTCSLCLDACPTGALPEPYRLDSRLCISYWTIEHRGAIPSHIRPMLGEWVFGCDVCQEVCPINLDLDPVDHAEFRIPAHRSHLDLADLLGMDREEYTTAFRHSPMKRSKLVGLQRNAALAMGNSRELRYTNPLIRALNRGEPLVRCHAAWALGQIGGTAGLAALRKALTSESDPEVRVEIQTALQLSG